MLVGNFVVKRNKSNVAELGGRFWLFVSPNDSKSSVRESSSIPTYWYGMELFYYLDSFCN